MRNQLLLTAGKGEHVNVQQRASAAADRHGGRDYIREVEATAQTPRVLTLSDILQGVLSVNMKTRDGDAVQFSVKTLLAVAALIISLGGAAFYLVFTTATVAARQETEAAIRARDNAELKEILRDYQAQVVSGFVTTQAYIAANSNKVQFMTGLMTREQQERVRRYEEANPLPKLPDPEQFKYRQPRKGAPSDENEEGSQINYVRSGL